MDRNPKDPYFYLITGTGRCGTMLLADLLSQATDAICEHEQCFRHQSMVEYGLHSTSLGYQVDIRDQLLPRIEAARGNGKLYGVSSGHAYFALDQLYEQFGDRARFILMVREPSEFVRSALARGFFDPGHANYCNQATPSPNDPIAARWDSATPLEKNLWYWQRVNSYAINRFAQLPADVCKVVRMEDLNAAVVASLCDFLGIHGLSESQIALGLNNPVNVSPTSGREGRANPYSVSKFLPPLQQWPAEWIDLLKQYTEPLRSRLYGPLPA